MQESLNAFFSKKWKCHLAHSSTKLLICTQIFLLCICPFCCSTGRLMGFCDMTSGPFPCLGTWSLPATDEHLEACRIGLYQIEELFTVHVFIYSDSDDEIKQVCIFVISYCVLYFFIFHGALISIFSPPGEQSKLI